MGRTWLHVQGGHFGGVPVRCDSPIKLGERDPAPAPALALADPDLGRADTDVRAPRGPCRGAADVEDAGRRDVRAEEPASSRGGRAGGRRHGNGRSR